MLPNECKRIYPGCFVVVDKEISVFVNESLFDLKQNEFILILCTSEYVYKSFIAITSQGLSYIPRRAIYNLCSMVST